MLQGGGRKSTLQWGEGEKGRACRCLGWREGLRAKLLVTSLANVHKSKPASVPSMDPCYALLAANAEMGDHIWGVTGRH